MNQFEENPIAYLKLQLKTKAFLKQKVWTVAQNYYSVLKSEAAKIISKLKKDKDLIENINVEFLEVNEHEFHISFGSDRLIYLLQTNVVTLPKSHPAMNGTYLKQNPDRTFFGQIMIYDFMEESIKNARSGDTGYLLGRVLVNVENQFLLEGVRDLFDLFSGIQNSQGNEENLSLLINKTLAIAVDSDLQAPAIDQISRITLGSKLAGTKEVGHGPKIGFQMDSNEEPDV